jgi:hypothetical protein
MVTANLTATEEPLPHFYTQGSRSAGGVGPVLYDEAYALASAVSPAATGADNVIGSYSLPAGFFDAAPLSSTIATGTVVNTAGIFIRVVGRFAATANNKTVKIIFNPTTAVVGSTVGSGGTTLVSSGVVAINNLGFVLEAWVRKVGANDSNSQVGGQLFAQVGATFVSPPITQAIAAVENAAILIAVTGNAATATSDILLDHFYITATC